MPFYVDYVYSGAGDCVSIRRDSMKALYLVVDTQHNKVLKVYRRYSSALNYISANDLTLALVVQEVNYE